MAEIKIPNEEFDTLPSTQDLCLTIPLYKQFRLNEDDAISPVYSLRNYIGTLDCFCQGCLRHTVFKRADEPKYIKFTPKHNFVFVLFFDCSRNDSHHAVFVFRFHEGILQKIGQYPSIADLAAPSFQKYRPVLGEEGFRELSRAVGLASHGVGIGAFVYLRRIFETQIERARQLAATDENWDEASFETARMDEKILMLKQHLPKFLVDNRSLYGLMSLGVHALSEKQCLESFPVVRVGIELILDEQLEKHNRDKKITEATKSISSLGSELKGK